MTADEMEKSLRDFQNTVKDLSTSVGSVSSIWADSKYAELFSAVSKLAMLSKDIMASGDRCVASIQKFDTIAAKE